MWCYHATAHRGIASHRGERARLVALTRSRTAAHCLVERAQIVLAAAGGESGSVIWQRLGVSRPTATCWLDRYEAGGLAGVVTDRPRFGRAKQLSITEAEASADRILHTTPPKDATHCSAQPMAGVTGHHHASIARI